MNRRIDISHKTIFFIAAFLAILWSLFLIKEVIILLFVAIIFMSALSPIVNTLQTRLRFPRALSIVLVYVVIVSVIGGLVSLMVTPLINQTSGLVTSLPQRIESLIPEGAPIDASLIQQEASNLSHNAVSFTVEIFNSFIALVSVAVLTAYLLLERTNLDKLTGQLFIGREEKARRVVSKLEDKLGSWLRGQVALSLIISILVYIVLTVLGIPYAIPLAILAGLMEVVPVIGPIISAIPAIIIAFFISPLSAIMVSVAYLVIQQLENHLIVPQVMKKAVGLNPIIVILAVAIGGKLLGIAGALLAVPITVVIQIILEDVLQDDGQSS